MAKTARPRLAFLGFVASALALSPAQNCAQLARTRIKNAHSISTRYLHAGESYRVPASCGTDLGADLRAQASVNVCVVNVVYNTSSTSATRIEAWLPDAEAWYGRLLGTGGGGLGGCVDYGDLSYGTSLHFATFGSDGGHDGDKGIAFSSSDEVIADYAHRALHVATVTSKVLVKAYYGRVQDKTYYIGCSNGGRQGFRAAQDYPADFDGLLAGAPAFDMTHLMGASAIWNISAAKLSEEDWSLVRSEILRQCDGLDGLHDGIIDEPDACAFIPEVLLCDGNKRVNCLSADQVSALRRIYSPLYGHDGKLLYPRVDPGAEGDTTLFNFIFSSPLYAYALDWMRYVVYHNPAWLPNSNFGLADIYAAEKRDVQVPVSSFNPDLSAFRKRGGKLLTYHGRRDMIIPSGNSLRYYQLVARTLSLSPSQMDEFYRLFLVPGMNHCYHGPGAWKIGQISAWSSWSNSSDSNALFALVDWVESNKAPETLRGSTDGTADAAGPKLRLHCKYPAISVWKEDVQDWVCVAAP